MVLLRSIVFITMFFVSTATNAEDLDALLSSLSTAKEAIPTTPEDDPVEPAEAEPAMPVEPEDEPVAEPTMPAPEMPKAVLPVMPTAGMPEPIMPEPIMPKAIMPVPGEPPMPAPVMPKAIMPTPGVTPVMPKFPISPVEAPAMPIEIDQPAPTMMAPKIMTTAAPVMADPAPVKVQMEITDVHEISDDGLSTLHVDNGGNWLEKRVWYKKAEQMFEIIRTTIQKASDVRMKFVHEVNQVGQHVDEFYETVGFKKGQIDELLQALASELKTEEKIRGGDLSSGERSIKLKVKDEEQLLATMSDNFKMIEDLDDQVDKTMMKAFKEIDACRALETKAWNNFKDIGMELDDKKAKVLYYEMENFHKNIEQKLTYLQSNLLQYLQTQLVTKVTQTTGEVKSSAQTLSGKGLAMQTILEKDEKGDFVVLRERDEAKDHDENQKESGSKRRSKSRSADDSSDEQTWYQSILYAMLGYGYMVLGKLADWFMIAACCVQTVLCNIKEMICNLFGK